MNEWLRPLRLERTLTGVCLVIARYVSLVRLCGVIPAPSSTAQSVRQPIPRIAQRVADETRIQLSNTTDLRIRSALDLGRINRDLMMERVALALKSSPEQIAALEKLLKEQQEPASANYHHWLTPEEFGGLFGVSQADIDVITVWLQSHGLTVYRVANSRREIEFSGTVAQIERAFRTEIHQYNVDGELHIANSGEISIPLALGSVVEGLVSLSDLHLEPMGHH